MSQTPEKKIKTRMDAIDEQIHIITINKISPSNHLIKSYTKSYTHYTPCDMMKGFVEDRKQHAKPCSEPRITDTITKFPSSYLLRYQNGLLLAI